MESDSPEVPPARRRLFAALAWVYVVAAPVLAALARLVGHPGYYFDGETQIPPTIGRELLHGHFDDAIHYQIIVYQGSLLWDAAMSAVAYAVFGDHLLAWHAVPLAYFAGLSVAGTLLLRRTAGMPWALLFPTLLAALPFFVKDGFVSGIGGHAPGAFFAVAGLAVAAYASDDGGKKRYAVLAGMTLGFGCWYVRTVVLALPAAAVLVGRRATGRLLLALGLLVLPILLAWNVHALQEAGTHSAAKGTTEQLVRAVVMNVGSTKPVRIDPVHKVLEATGPAVRTILYAQPMRAGTSEQTFRPLAYTAGTAWAAAWLGCLLLLPLLLLLPGVRRRPESARGVLATWVLGCTYVGAYALSSLNLDPGIVESLRRYPPLPPGVSGGRYLVPVMGILTLGVAQAIAALGEGVDRRPAWLLAAPLVVLGLLPALGDWRYDRDPADLWHHMPPHQYSGAFGPGRGPPLDVHLACTDTDPESRAAHLDAISRFLVPSPGAAQPPPLSESIAALSHTYSADEIATLVSSLGGNLARDHQGGSVSFAEMTQTAFETAAGLGPGSGDSYLLGLRRSLTDARLDVEPADLVAGLCGESPSGTRPLCTLAGERLAAPLGSGWPASAQDLYLTGTPPLGSLDRSVRDALLYGAAVRLTQLDRSRVLPPDGPQGWEPSDARVFVQKWRVKGGKVAPPVSRPTPP